MAEQKGGADEQMTVGRIVLVGMLVLSYSAERDLESALKPWTSMWCLRMSSQKARLFL